MKHHIIIKFNSKADKQVLIPEIKKYFDNAYSIEGVKKVEVFTSSMNLRNRFDMMIKIDLTKQALKNFEESKLYETWNDKYSAYISKKTIFDY